MLGHDNISSLYATLSHDNVGSFHAMLGHDNVGFLHAMLGHDNVGFLHAMLGHDNVGFLHAMLGHGNVLVHGLGNLVKFLCAVCIIFSCWRKILCKNLNLIIPIFSSYVVTQFL